MLLSGLVLAGPGLAPKRRRVTVNGTEYELTKTGKNAFDISPVGVPTTALSLNALGVTAAHGSRGVLAKLIADLPAIAALQPFLDEAAS